MPPRAATLPLLFVSGEWEEAVDLAEVTREDGSPLERPMAVTILGQILRARGEIDRAWEMVREILPRGSASEPEDALFPYAMDTLRLATRLSLDVGDVEHAREWVQAHDRWLAWSGALRGRAESSILWSRIHRLEGDQDAAERAAREGVQRAAEPRQPLVQIDADRTLGLLLLEQGNLAGAGEHLSRASALANECVAPSEQVQCDVALAQLYQRQGEQREAVVELLSRARSRAVLLRAAPLLNEIDQLLTTPVEPDKLELLTVREQEVLRMVARGLTDAEAADELFISPRTVSQHLRSVYNKLGVSSRAAATRWAVENELI